MVCIIKVIDRSLPSEKQEEFKRMGINSPRIDLLKNDERTLFAEQQGGKIDTDKMKDIQRVVTGHYKRRGDTVSMF